MVAGALRRVNPAHVGIGTLCNGTRNTIKRSGGANGCAGSEKALLRRTGKSHHVALRTQTAFF
jgi:hypothetical protein